MPQVAHSADAVLDQRLPSTAVGDLVVDGELAIAAAGVAADQPAVLTRSTYAGVYRAFCAFLGPGAGRDELTRANVRAYRGSLEASGKSPATIAKHLSALRTLAAALGAHDVHQVRGGKVARGEPRPLTVEQYARLLRMPDRRTLAGRRDLALLHLLGTAGLRRAEACSVLHRRRRRARARRRRASDARSRGRRRGG